MPVVIGIRHPALETSQYNTIRLASARALAGALSSDSLTLASDDFRGFSVTADEDESRYAPSVTFVVFLQNTIERTAGEVDEEGFSPADQMAMNLTEEVRIKTGYGVKFFLVFGEVGYSFTPTYLKTMLGLARRALRD